jgi:uncharacterized membrane protein
MGSCGVSQRGVSFGAASLGVLWAGGVAVLGCSSASERQTGLRTSTDQHGPALPAGDGTGSDDGSGYDVSVGAEPATGDGSTATPCVASAEFVPLGVVPDQYYPLWKFLDPRSGFVYWTHEYTGNDVRIDAYRWTASGGIENLNELLQLPAGEGESRMDVLYVSSDGRVILGLRRADDDTEEEVFRYTPETGTVALDFYPSALSRDGKVAIDFRDGRPQRWTETGDKTQLALPTEMADWSFDSAQFWLSETGDTLLGVGVLAGADAHVLRWTAANGWVNLGLLPAGAAGPDTIAMTVSEAGDAIAGTLGNPAEGGSRVFRWTESSGSTNLGELAGVPPEASYEVSQLSADGSVVVGSVQISGQSASHVFRWTEALGMQDPMPRVGNVSPLQMSPGGDVVLAQELVGPTYRWTETGGVEDLHMNAWGASADASLVVGTRDGLPALAAFPGGSSASPTLAELAPSTIVPAHWSGAVIEGVSADGRLIVGNAWDPLGQREAWLLRRTERCPLP